MWPVYVSTELNLHICSKKTGLKQPFLTDERRRNIINGNESFRLRGPRDYRKPSELASVPLRRTQWPGHVYTLCTFCFFYLPAKHRIFTCPSHSLKQSDAWQQSIYWITIDVVISLCFAFYNYKNVKVWVKHGGKKTKLWRWSKHCYVYRFIYNDHKQFKTLLILHIKPR